MEINIVCQNCGRPADKDEEQSNENWSVYINAPCPECGGEMKPEISKSSNK